MGQIVSDREKGLLRIKKDLQMWTYAVVLQTRILGGGEGTILLQE